MSRPKQPSETTRAILYLLSEGHTVEEILALHPTLTRDDVATAAGLALGVMEEKANQTPEGSVAGWCDSCGKVVTKDQRHVRVTYHGRGANRLPDLYHAKCGNGFRQGWGA